MHMWCIYVKDVYADVPTCYGDLMTSDVWYFLVKNPAPSKKKKEEEAIFTFLLGLLNHVNGSTDCPSCAQNAMKLKMESYLLHKLVQQAPCAYWSLQIWPFWMRLWINCRLRSDGLLQIWHWTLEYCCACKGACCSVRLVRSIERWLQTLSNWTQIFGWIRSIIKTPVVLSSTKSFISSWFPVATLNCCRLPGLVLSGDRWTQFSTSNLLLPLCSTQSWTKSFTDKLLALTSVDSHKY